MLALADLICTLSAYRRQNQTNALNAYTPVHTNHKIRTRRLLRDALFNSTPHARYCLKYR